MPTSEFSGNWISVKEDLPVILENSFLDCSETVLVVYRKFEYPDELILGFGSLVVGFLGEGDEPYWSIRSTAWHGSLEVLYWMPLPNLPEVEDV